MGNNITHYLLPHLWKEDEPDCFAPIKYDPHFGFEEPRKKMEKLATEEEMNSACIENIGRDYCVHKRLVYRGCVKANQPFWYRCKGLRSELADCYYEQKLHDMKEFEREKRLNARERRLAQQVQ